MPPACLWFVLRSHKVRVRPWHQPPELDVPTSPDRDGHELGTEGAGRGPGAWGVPKPPASITVGCAGATWPLPGTGRLRANCSPRGTRGTSPAGLRSAAGAAGLRIGESPGRPRAAGSGRFDAALQTWFLKHGGRGVPQVQALADTAWTQIPKGKGRMDGASLAQMSWASSLHSGAAPQISATEGPQKAARFIGGLCELCIAWPLAPRIPCLPGGQIIPGRASCQRPGRCKVLCPARSASDPAARTGISLPGPRVQIECPFERARRDPVPLLLGLHDTRSSRLAGAPEATASPTPGGRAPTPRGPTRTGVPARGGQASPGPGSCPDPLCCRAPQGSVHTHATRMLTHVLRPGCPRLPLLLLHKPMGPGDPVTAP